MLEIPYKTVRIRENADHRDKFCLVHNGKEVRVLIPPGPKTATHGDNVMLVGTLDELQQQIKALGLKAAKNAHIAADLGEVTIKPEAPAIERQ